MSSAMYKYNAEVSHIKTQISKLKAEALLDPGLTMEQSYLAFVILGELEKRLEYAAEQFYDEMQRDYDEVHDND